MIPTMKTRRQAIGITLIAGMIWGTSFPIIKIGLFYLDSYTFVFLRLLIAAVAVMTVAAPLGRISLSYFKSPQVWLLGLLNAGGFTLQYIGMTMTLASKTALLIDSNVIEVAIISSLLYKEHLSGRTKIAVLAGLVGVTLLATGGDLSELAKGQLLGDILVFLAGVSWAFFMVLNKRMVAQGVNASSLTGCVMTVTALITLPLYLSLGTTDLTMVEPIGWAIVLFTGVFCSAIAYFLWNQGLENLSVTVSALILLIEIVWALLLSFTLLNETLTLAGMIGACLILLSILLVS